MVNEFRDPLLVGLFDDLPPAEPLRQDLPLLDRCRGAACVYPDHRRGERPECRNCGHRKD